MRRWLVERFFAWIQWQRRILVRWEYHARNFLCFVQFASSLSSSGDFEIGSSHDSIIRVGINYKLYSGAERLLHRSDLRR